MLTYVLSVPAFSNALVNILGDTYAVPSLEDVGNTKGNLYIVVLTGGWFRVTPEGYEIKLAPAGWERTWAAVKLWKQTGGSVIFSGAPLPDESDSVAQAMVRMAQQLGLPKERVLVETLSRNTHENLLFTQRRFHLSEDDTVVLLTSALHLPCSAAIARQLGIKVIPYPCDYRGDKRQKWQLWLPTNDAAQANEEVMHELVGILAYWWRGWVWVLCESEARASAV